MRFHIAFFLAHRIPMKPLIFAALTAVCIALPARAVPIAISVVGPDDKMLPNAIIDLRQSDASALFFGGATQAVEIPVANNDGTFNFDWDKALLAPDAPLETRIKATNILWARISAPGMATQTRRVSAAQTTIHLTTGRAWSGAVRDQNDQPVAGVRVQLKGWTLDENPDARDINARDVQAENFQTVDAAWAIKSVTDAQGRWQFDSVPARGLAVLELSRKPYARADFVVKMSGETAPPLFLSPGASVAGQLLLPDGKPLVGHKVNAGWSGEPENSTLTDAQGRFLIGGLTAGATYVSEGERFDYFAPKTNKDATYLFAGQNMVEVRAGETTDIGQWKAQIGVMLRFRAVDSDSGKPVEGAEFNSFMRGSSAKSDAQGRVQARVIRSDSSYPFVGSVRTPNYISYQIPQLAGAQRSGTVDLGDIKLERGSIVSGTVRVQGAAPGAATPTDSLSISLQMGGATEQINFRDGGNTFKTSAIKAGNYFVYAVGQNGNVTKDWEIISPKTLAVPAPGVAAKPVEFVVKRVAPLPAVVKVARGRLLDAQGQGVAGAVVSGQFVQGYNSSGASAVTDDNGDWRAQTSLSATDFKLFGIERPGYVKAGAETISIADGVAVVSGVSLQRRGAAFAGRVTDADGKPASGAWVAVVEARDYEPVRADENGAFELPDLPLANFTIIAGRGVNWARVETNADAKNTALELKAPAPFEREAAVKSALAGQTDWFRAEQYWDILGLPRMEALSGGDDAGKDWDRAQFALQLAERNPAAFLQRAPDLIGKISDLYKGEVEAQWRLAQANSNNADEKIAANNWVDERKAAKKNIDVASVTELLRVAAAARALKRADADDLSDYAAAIAAQVSAGARDEAETWGLIMGASGYAATLRFVDGMKPMPEFKVWAGALQNIAKSGDAAGTKTAIARMETLALTPEAVELARTESWNSPTNQIQYSRTDAARALADSDLLASIALVDGIDDTDYGKQRAAQTLADRAIKAGDLATAEKLLRGAMKSRISNPEGFALSASLAQEVSPQLGAEMWAEALRKAMPSKSDFGGGFVPSVGMWAFYHARLDAAQSRVLIEREWNWQLPAAAKVKKDDDGMDESPANLERLEMAMGAIDPARALEMRAEAAKIVNLPERANVGLAAALLASDAQRARFGVDGRF